MVTSHDEPDPEQWPVQPPNNVSAMGIAVSITVVFVSKFATQFGPQSIPAGSLTTVPAPEPDFDTDSVSLPLGARGSFANSAVTKRLSSTFTEQVSDLPVQ